MTNIPRSLLQGENLDLLWGMDDIVCGHHENEKGRDMYATALLRVCDETHVVPGTKRENIALWWWESVERS
jgi:hypothetical protein